MENLTYKGSIRTRLIGIIMLVTTLTGLIGYSSFVYWYMGNQYDRALKLSQSVGLVLGQDIAKLVLLNEVSAATDISTQLKSFSKLNTMVLYNMDEQPVLQYSKSNQNFKITKLPNRKNRVYKINGNLLKLYINAMYQERHLGYIEFSIEIETITDIIKKDLAVLIFILLFMFVMSFILAQFFASRFTNPILKLVNFLEKIHLFESLSQRISTKERNEYGKLYKEVNTMLERIESSQQALKIAAVSFETQSGMTITDKNQKILHVNDAFTKITGYSANEAIGQTPSILNSGLHDGQFYQNMYNSLKTNHFWMGEINNRHKDGSIVNEHLTIHAILNDEHDIIYYVGSFVDLTPLKQTQAKLKEKELLLVQQSKMAAMGEMLENIAHQWRQPLSAITTTATGLVVKKEIGMQTSPQEDAKELNLINETAQYLSQTIDDFRTFFKTNKAVKSFNLKETYTRTLKLVNPKFKSFKIEVIEDIEDITIHAQENELIQIMMNLLNNAKDILTTKEIDRKLILVHIYEENNNAILTICDNGGGVPEDIIHKIFEPYFTTKHQSNGTGIGLYMSQEMISKHLHGTLTVENREFEQDGINYKGACFKATIPLS